VATVCLRVKGLPASDKTAQAYLFARDNPDHHTPGLTRDCEIFAKPQRVDYEALVWINTTQRCTQEDAGVDGGQRIVQELCRSFVLVVE
jgi:hypothetical protein